MADQLTQQANQAVATVDAQNPYAASGTDPNAALFKSSMAGQGSSSAPVTMTPEMATGNAPVALPVVPPAPDTSAGLAGGAVQTAKSLQDYITQLTPPETAADQQQQAVLDRITQLTGETGGRQQAQIDAENASGATAARQKLTDINNELTIANANYEKQFANLGGNGVVETAGMLNAQQAGLRRAQAADVALIAARAQAAQGNLTIALDTANRAVDAKYSAVEDNLKIAQAQLNAIMPRLDKEQRIQAEALSRQYEEQKQKTAEEKAASKENLNLALTAGITTKFVNRNGQFFDAATGKPFSTPADFFAAAGVASFEEAYQKGLVTDFSADRVAEKDFVSQLAAKYPDAGIKPSDSQEVAQQKLSNSKIYRKDTYIAPSGGGGGGLTQNAIQSTLNQIANGFDNEPIVKNFNVVNEGYEYAKMLEGKDAVTSADDQGLIYAFAKAQDPNSAVREGEYTTVQKYSQSLIQQKWADAKRIASNEPFLTPEARKNMVGTIKAKYEASRKNYDNVYKEYNRRIEDAQSGKVSASITNYAGAYETPAAAAQNQPPEMVLPDGTVVTLQPDGTYQ